MDHRSGPNLHPAKSPLRSVGKPERKKGETRGSSTFLISSILLFLDRWKNHHRNGSHASPIQGLARSCSIDNHQNDQNRCVMIRWTGRATESNREILLSRSTAQLVMPLDRLHGPPRYDLDASIIITDPRSFPNGDRRGSTGASSEREKERELQSESTNVRPKQVVLSRSDWMRLSNRGGGWICPFAVKTRPNRVRSQTLFVLTHPERLSDEPMVIDREKREAQRLSSYILTHVLDQDVGRR